MIGDVYEKYKLFGEKFNVLRNDFQVKLEQSKAIANICINIIFIVIFALGIAIGVVTTAIGRTITASITEPVEQIEAAVASLRKGELSNVEMLTYESDDEFGDTIKNLKEAMNILSDYVREISREVKMIAQGDLTRNGEDITDFLGDFSELKHSLLYILKRFNSTLTDISNIAEQVSLNSNDVENASKSLADGATEQAGVIQELNATIETVIDIAVNVAKETQSASDRVKASADRAHKEKEKMNDLLKEMEHITEISKEIGNIITDIEDIASQTNLLSLNASIEAARAGENGRGFEVVATQIGKLAQTSAESVHTIENLIQQINGYVGACVTQANVSVSNIGESGQLISVALETFDSIFQNIAAANELVESMVTKVSKVDDVATNVAAISEEQAASSQEILATSDTMVSQAQEITRSSTHAAEDSKELSVSAEELSNQVNKFKI